MRECLLDPDVASVLAIGRAPAGQQDVKLLEIVHPDLSDLASIENRLAGFDACFFCLGVSAAGMNEQAYRRVTYDLTVSAAGTLAKLNPYRALYAIMGPLYPMWKLLFPKYVTTAECVGRAILKVTRHGTPKRELENQDINSHCRD